MHYYNSFTFEFWFLSQPLDEQLDNHGKICPTDG